MKIAIDSPYTQESSNFKNGGLLCKHIYLENIFNISLLIVFLIIDESNYKFATDQMIRKSSLNHVLKVYALSYPCFIQHFYVENIFNISLWKDILINDEYKYKVSTDQIIQKLFPKLGLEV